MAKVKEAVGGKPFVLLLREDRDEHWDGKTPIHVMAHATCPGCAGKMMQVVLRVIAEGAGPEPGEEWKP